MQKVDWKQMYAKEKAPPFGKELLKYFMLDPDYLNLNSGKPPAAWSDLVQTHSSL